MRLLHDYPATLLVQFAGEADGSVFPRCELHYDRRAELEFASAIDIC